MHTVLEIKELLGLVMVHLREDHLSTLVPLTRTCGALSEPALDLIWAKAPLYHLACTISESAWTRTYRRCSVEDVVDEENEEGSHGEKEDLWTISIAEDLIPSQSDLGVRFRSCARRVRALDLRDVFTFPTSAPMVHRALDASVLRLWSWMQMREQVFAHISAVYLDEKFLSCDDAADFLSAFAYPGDVATLHLNLMHGSEPMPSARVVDVLHTLAPGLRKLTVWTEEKTSQAEWFNPLLCRTPRLSELNVEFPVEVISLSHMLQAGCRLESLSLWAVVGDLNELDLAEDALKCLRAIHVFYDTPSWPISRILLARCGPSLRDCMIQMRPDAAYDFEEIVTFACVIKRFPHLRRVDISVIDPPASPATEAEVHAVFDALRACACLETLHLGLPLGGHLDAACVTSIVNGCPALTAFTLDVGADGEDQLAAMPLAAFLAILRAHPRLTELPVRLDVSVLPDPEERTTHAYGASICLEDTSDAQVAAFCALAAALLPNVCEIETGAVGANFFVKSEEGMWEEDPDGGSQSESEEE